MRSGAAVAIHDSNPARKARVELILTRSSFIVAAAGDRAVRLLLCQRDEFADGAAEEGLRGLRERFGCAAAALLCEWPAPRQPPGQTASASDMILDCCNPATLVSAVARLLAAAIRAPQTATTELIGDSAAMHAVRATIELVAPSDATVLITGETGTGKECATAMVRRLSRRAKGPLVALNCAAIPDELLEGELFGYERGAFTGAHKAYPGKLKLAHHGTLALDEVGDLSLIGQAKILRAIETREVFRLGGTAAERFDARIIAATNADLSQRVAAGAFRKDLYYRLAVALITLPPLRERREDIAALAAHFAERFGQKLGCGPLAFSDTAFDALCAHDWPGNVRELMNVIEIAALKAKRGVIGADHLGLQPAARVRMAMPPPEAEKQRLVAALAACGGNKSLAAKRLQCSRMTLYRKLDRYHIAAAPQARGAETV